MSRIRCAGWPAGTKSCTEGGSNQISSTRQGRKLFVISSANQIPTEMSSNFTRYRDTLLNCQVAEHCWDPVGLAIAEYAYRFQRLPAVSRQG